MDELESIVVKSMATQIKVLEAERAQLIEALKNLTEERDSLLEASKESCNCEIQEAAEAPGDGS